MIKRIFTAVILVTLCAFLCSCTSNYAKDVHFIHAVCFDKNTSDNTYQILAVFEKQSADGESSKEQKEYFVDTQKGKSFEEILDKLTKKYTGSYYASNTLYFLPESTDSQTINEVAVFLSQSNILPSKAEAVFITNTTASDFLDTIKNQQDIKKILKLTHNKKTNIINFLANFDNKGVTDKIPRLTLTNNKKNITLYKTHNEE